MTRPLAEAWSREVSQVVSVTQQVVGEVCARQPLGATMGEPVMRALESRLAAGEPGWRQTDDGFRCDVEGGYVVYAAEDRELVLVASAQGEVGAQGRASETQQGLVQGEAKGTGESMYYEDNFGGRTKARGEREAREHAERQVHEETRTAVEKDKQRVEAERAHDLEDQARADAQRNLEPKARALHEDLVGQARAHLEAVRVRGTRAFNEVLARAYKDAILAYAKRHNADNVQCNESDGMLEIEFDVQR